MIMFKYLYNQLYLRKNKHNWLYMIILNIYTLLTFEDILNNHNLITYTTTKKVTLNTSRHTLFLANTPTLRLLILIPSITHSQSQQTQKRKLVSQSTRITLVTEDNLKSIQA